jgi:hypothetical protein
MSWASIAADGPALGESWPPRSRADRRDALLLDGTYGSSRKELLYVAKELLYLTKRGVIRLFKIDHAAKFSARHLIPSTTLNNELWTFKSPL